MQTKHARNEKHFNSTKRNNIKRRIRGSTTTGIITRTQALQTSSKTNAQSRGYHRKIKNFSNFSPFGNDDNFGNYPDAADVKIQPKSQDYLIKIQYFCNISLVSLSIHPRSRRGAQRIKKGEGRWSRPPKTFTCFIRSSPADVKQNKQTLKPCRRQAKRTKKMN